MSLAEPRRRYDGLIRVIFGVALGEADPARLEERGLPHEPRVRFSGMTMMSLAEPRRRYDGLIRVIFGVALGAVGRLAEQAAGAIEDGDVVHDGS